MMIPIAIVGAGAWGTALGLMLARKGHEVLIWAHETKTAESINTYHINEQFLPGIPLNERLSATSSIPDLLAFSDIILASAPSHVTRLIAEQMCPYVRDTHGIVVCSKGIEQHTLEFMSSIYEKIFENIAEVAVLSGPTFAKEIALGLPGAAVLACKDPEWGERLQHELCAPQFRVYRSDDIIGVQVGGCVKNVIAIAAGICDGMSLGLNARSALICRGLAEISRLGVKLGGASETFTGLSGLGDLVLTATGTLSRNHTLGVQLGQGHTLEECVKTGGSIAEGVKNAVSLSELIELHQVEMPICRAVYEILYQNVNCADALQKILQRELPQQENS